VQIKAPAGTTLRLTPVIVAATERNPGSHHRTQIGHLSLTGRVLNVRTLAGHVARGAVLCFTPRGLGHL
jgi:hypothetical protein